MTDVEKVESYGSNLSLFEKLKLLAEWSPLLGKLQAVITATDPHEQALAVVSALEWAAGKTGTAIDDEALEHIEAILRSEAGKKGFEWAVRKVTGK